MGRTVSAVFRVALLPLVFLLPAGTWRWWEAWVLIGLYVAWAVGIVIFLSRRDPALLAERLRGSPVQKNQKGWDRIVLPLMLVVGIAVVAVPGLDVVRLGWSEPLPLWLRVTAMALHVPCFVAVGWVMHENTFLSRVVKIDSARGHEVITTGPYALVRHPMYSAVLVLVFAMPLALGSRFGLIAAGAMAALVIVRTVLEDRTLQQELPGYREYALVTRFRLVPGVW